jgi:hypothetical protein
MLLLGLDPELFKNSEELQSDNLKSYLIDDLFECNLGLNEANYGTFSKDGNIVTYLKLGSFIDDDKNMNLPIQDYNKRNILEPGIFDENNNSETNEINEKDKTPVPIKKLLQPSDFLISIRGRIKGFSMLHTFESLGENDRLVCSNHFIHLKPRSFTLSDMYMPYLHLLLHFLVKQININFKESKGGSSTNSLKVDELREYRVNLHTNIDEQKKVFEEYEKRHIEFQQANLQYERFMNQLSNSLLNNHK